LAAALAAAFERGNGPVVVVGSDSPGLSAEHVSRALTLVAGDPLQVVLGPCLDGGFYLLAAGRPIPGLAEAARWCRADTLASLRASLAGLGRPVVLLEPLIDLDRRADLERWLAGSSAQGSWRRIARRLRTALAAERRPEFLWSIGRSTLAHDDAAAGRAPPLRRAA
jgi:glycosyltransferase A (GT-A) superfamily protein (DUF2064 family)